MLFARDLAARAISVLDEQITRLETFYAQKYPDANEMPKQRSSYGNLAAAGRPPRSPSFNPITRTPSLWSDPEVALSYASPLPRGPNREARRREYGAANGGMAEDYP
mmetsp:Transcript_40107/g.125572  ORF Transcript_40107/g.125572 Transcript_40107/m.125572 type:complete len:107 (+) Transcript_40107:42-362(+)